VTTLLLDASVWLAARDADDRYHVAARRLIDDVVAQPSLAALDLTLYEVANVPVKRWSPERARTVAALVRKGCSGTVVAINEELCERAVALADEHGLTVYDAVYVAAAQMRGWKLVSGDVKDLVRPGLAVPPDDPSLN
jgi:predicted nucleic acid-binding protein